MNTKWLDRFEEILISFLIAGATLIIFVSVLHRYLSGVPLGGLQTILVGVDMGWAQELAVLMMVWMAKFGAAYGVRVGIHVGVDVLVNRLSPQNQKPLILFGLLAGALFTGVIATIGAQFVHEQYEFGAQTSVLQWPNWLVYIALPVASSLMCFRFLQVAWQFHATGVVPHHEHAHVDGLEEEVAL
jgi:C4-dicarboxylate transporter DctQ subunit